MAYCNTGFTSLLLDVQFLVIYEEKVTKKEGRKEGKGKLFDSNIDVNTHNIEPSKVEIAIMSTNQINNKKQY